MENSSRIQDQETFIVEDEHGNEQTYTVDAVIEMNEKQYILYSNGDEVIINLIINEDGEEYLADASEDEIEQIFDAYQQALLEEEE